MLQVNRLYTQVYQSQSAASVEASKAHDSNITASSVVVAGASQSPGTKSAGSGLASLFTSVGGSSVGAQTGRDP